jgi:hypothetical protein
MEERNVLCTVKKRNFYRVSYILGSNCLLKRVTKGKIEGRIHETGRGGRRSKQLLHNLKE